MTKPFGPVKLRLRFGESVSEAMHDANNDHAINDMVVAVPPMGAQEFAQTGFRFLRIDLLSESSEAEIVSVRAVSVLRENPRIGEFRCSDDRLNAIWQVGADTVTLCMQDYVWDGIKRDRIVWIGDMHPEVSVIAAVYGADPIVPASLDWARDLTPLPNWMNGIPSYSMWWLLIQADWFRYQGDRAYLDAQKAYLGPLLEQLAGYVAADGTPGIPGRKFLDWPSHDDPAAVDAGLHALLILALERGAELAALLRLEQAQASALDAARRLRGAAKPLPTLNKQAAAIHALAGLDAAANVNAAVLARNPLTGVSTFYGYYILQARALAGDHAGAIDLIRTFWGAMLDLGATSFWEDFNLDWAVNAGRIDELPVEGQVDVHMTYGDHCYKSLRHSLCHGWAAGPTAWLSEHVLGVTPAAPGFAKARIAPHLGDLAWAEGVFPTPHGPLKVRHEKRPDGSVASEAVPPTGVEVVEG
jgi:hypothetical protein